MILGIAISALALFVLLELSARLYLFGFAGLSPARVDSVHGLHETGFTRPSRHPELVYELEPNIRGYFKLVPFHTNSRSLRDVEYALAKPENVFRVAVVGSSFSLPAGVEIERAFHTLLEDRVSRELAPIRAEFINFAVAGYGPRQILAMLELEALPYDPDLVLFATTRLSFPLLAKLTPVQAATPPAIFRPPTHPFFHSFLLKLVEQRATGGQRWRSRYGIDTSGVIDRIVQSAVGFFEGPEPIRNAPVDVAPRKSRPERVDVLGHLTSIGEQSGIPIVVAHLEYEQKPRTAVELQLVAQIRKLGLHFVDTRTGFRGTRATDFWINELDPHPNDAAQEIFAKVIGDFLRSNGLLSPASAQ